MDESGNRNATENLIFDKLDVRGQYTDEYKNTVFWAWYMNGRPKYPELKAMIPPNIDGNIPGTERISIWVKEFAKKAQELDAQVEELIAQREAEIKIEMLNRHAEAGKNMLTWGLEYLKEHLGDLRPNSAIRLVETGSKLERQSRGVPELIAEISTTSDEDIINQIQKILGAGDILDGEIIEE